MATFNATLEEIVKVLGHFYPGMIFTLTSQNGEYHYEDLIVHPESPVSKPTLAEIQSHYEEARQLIIAERAYNLKVSKFQQTYPIQDQIVNIMTAMATAGSFAEFKNNATLVAMRQLWNSL